MTEPIAVILAAGRGSRMRELTNDKPKCLLPLAGRPLLHWQLEALKKAGLKQIAVVRGYKSHCLEGEFHAIDNPHWQSANMVRSLLCAFDDLEGKEILAAYSDIVYKPEHVKNLLAVDASIAVTYDSAWLDLWSLRNDNPLDDAETFHEEGGFLVEIGGKPRNLNEVRGQYMGLLKFSLPGIALVRRFVNGLPGPEADRLDMTGLLRGLLGDGAAIRTVPVSGGWCECDTENDLRLYEQMSTTKGWLHDWRTD